MNKNFDQFGKIKGLLSQALGVAVHHMDNNRSVNEAKSHIRQAIKSIDKVAKKQIQKRNDKNDQFKTWWGNIESGAVNAALSPMSPEAQAKSLEQINNMIDKEKDKLSDLNNVQNQLLND